MDWLSDIQRELFGVHLTIAPVNFLFFVLIAWGVYLARKETGGFFAWLFPADVWRNRSVRTDIGLFVIGRVMNILGIVARFAGSPALAAYVASLFPGAALNSSMVSAVVLALLLWVCNDFASYWAHRGYHSIKVIWPLHAVHHSAAVLTPLTTYRQHPLDLLITTSFHTVVTGVILGLLVGAFDPSTSIAEIAGVNAFLVLANITVANFHHTHLWISFGPFLERIIISPAQHQIHHSTNPAHYNRNYGQILALWDWLFGTLYLIKDKEELQFGLNEASEAPLMTQRLWPVLWVPIRRMLGGSVRSS